MAAVAVPGRVASTSAAARVGRYELLDRTLGHGEFSKVQLARNVGSGELVAVKVLDKKQLRRRRMSDQVVQEISIMKCLGRIHPNIVQVNEVTASRTKIYIFMELLAGGSLQSTIDACGKLSEGKAKMYFQQLISAVEYCHRKGIYHRDLKLPNLLLDRNGSVLKVSDFGLSASSQQLGKDGLLHTRCGTPNYAAPEVIKGRGYDGAKADIWSCGVILFYILTGHLPFEDENLVRLYENVTSAKYSYKTEEVGSGARGLIAKMLNPNPGERISIAGILDDEWFKAGYQQPLLSKQDNDCSQKLGSVQAKEAGPLRKNAFELISTSEGLDLGVLFECPRNQAEVKRKILRFASTCPANLLLSRIEEAASTLNFNVQKQNYKLKLSSGSRNGRQEQLCVATEVFEVAPSFHIVELVNFNGDIQEFQKFYDGISGKLRDVICKPAADGYGIISGRLIN